MNSYDVKLGSPRPDMQSLCERWFAVSTRPSSELRACANLERQGWKTFLPRMSRTIRSGRRVQKVLRAVFPGYVFVSLDLRVDAWRSVDGTYGVRGLVKSGDVPSCLPIGLVENLKAMEDGEGGLSFSHNLKAGCKVKFLSGPFAEMIGSLERLDGNGRVLVLLDLLGRKTEVKTSAHELLPLP